MGLMKCRRLADGSMQQLRFPKKQDTTVAREENERERGRMKGCIRLAGGRLPRLRWPRRFYLHPLGYRTERWQ